MGYFTDIQKGATDKRLLPGIGKREIEASHMLSHNICDAETGTVIGKAQEIVSKGNGGSTITTLVLPNGDTAARAEEWETNDRGRRTAHVNVVFNKKYRAEESRPDENESYTIKRTFNKEGNVSSLEENDTRRTVHYYKSGITKKIKEERPSRYGLFSAHGFKDSRIIEFDSYGRIKKSESIIYSESSSRLDKRIDINKKKYGIRV